jgi:hypothetical protein
MTPAKAKSIPYNCNLVLKLRPYDRTVIKIINRDKTFIVQAKVACIINTLRLYMSRSDCGITFMIIINDTS